MHREEEEEEVAPGRDSTQGSTNPPGWVQHMQLLGKGSERH